MLPSQKLSSPNVVDFDRSWGNNSSSTTKHDFKLRFLHNFLRLPFGPFGVHQARIDRCLPISFQIA